jgi:hypothetical protein
MNIGIVFRCVIIAVAPFLLVLTLSCNPEDEIHQYFAELGLNRLAVLRTDIEAGALILVGKEGAVYSGSLRSYMSSPAVLADNSFQTYESVIGHYRGDRDVSGTAALSFIHGLFQFCPKADFTLAGTVRIDMVESRAESMEIADIKKVLGLREAQPFVQTVLEAIRDGHRAYLAYEVHRAKRLRIASVSNRDLAPRLEVGAVGHIPLTGKGDLSYKKISEREILLDGKKEYAFAIRAGELIPGPASNSVTFRVTNFLKPGYVKSAGTDDQYTSPINEGFAPLTIASAPILSLHY